jgi:iron complex outermembrane receptor protein
MSRVYLGGVLALSASIFACIADAQEAGTIPSAAGASLTLPAVNVVGSAPAGSLTVPSVEQQRKTINLTAGSVGFIDSEQLRDRYTRNLRDVLEDAPGVFVEQRYGQELRVSIRGSAIARGYHLRGLEILQDGFPVNLADGSGDFYQIDPQALRSVEIYKGGNGLAYGSSYLGGAINFVTPTAYTAVAPNLVRLEGGSFDTARLSLQVSRIFGDFDVLANNTATYASGFRQHERSKSDQFNANVGYRLTPDIETRFYTGAYVVMQQLPGALSLADALHNPTKANPAALAGDQARNSWTERVANRTSFRLDVGRLDIDSWAVHKALFHPIFQVLDQDGWTWGVAPRYTADGRIGGFRDQLIGGGRYFAGSNTALQFVNVSGNRAAKTLDSRQNSTNYEAYAENRFFFLPDVALMTGLKLLLDQRDYTDLGGLPADPIRKTARRNYYGVNPKIGLLWQPHDDIQVFADLTRSQDVPDFTDLTQTTAATTRFVPLAAQRAWTGEIGTRGKYDRFEWDATAYRSDIKGELLQFTVDPSIPAATFNAGNTVHQGIELGAKVDVWRDILAPAAGDVLRLSQIWTWSDFGFRGDRQYGNNALAGVPEHVLRTEIRYRHPSGFYFGPNIDWVPTGAWADFTNTQRAPGYVLLGLSGGYDLPNGLSFFVDARNLTNQHYVSDVSTVADFRTAANTLIFYPGDGISVFAGLRAAF